MWTWDRTIVQPLVHQALDRSWKKGDPGGEPPAGAHALLDHYAAWAVSVDHFAPVRAAYDYVANIPDPVLPGRDLATPDGAPVRYVGRIDALVLDQSDVPWVLAHRVGPDPFTDRELLILDEATTACCWAWEQGPLGPRVAGVLYNEIGTDPERFLRSEVRRTGAELEAAGRQLGFEALEMLDPGLRLYPSPSVGNCAPCSFRAPCLAMQQGMDPRPVLASGYRRRPDEEPEEGRLGGGTWGLGRGAAPPRFGRREGQ